MAIGEGRPLVTAILGPTNTGKTWTAIDRMLEFRTGMIGLPLRLLAREVYDKVRKKKGNASVGLVTGEERIIPRTARYWVCTTEAMPVGYGADFVAIDEIQLCADSERGHVFTDRLLNARGRHETMFLGAGTIKSIISELVPGIRIEFRKRQSELSYTGRQRISRHRPRTAIIAFNIDDVYMTAEAVRRHRGGAAVVMGGLSPRTRNAQVGIYQNGDVDYLVATDAIGMGLNLDIKHVAFGGLVKFDGHDVRKLHSSELAQIAGRAGRHKTVGTFGVTGDCPSMSRHDVESIEQNRFNPVTRIQWRNSNLDFGSVKSLLASLDEASEHRKLIKARTSPDLKALRTISEMADISDLVTSHDDVRLLWDVCRLPDYRKYGSGSHTDLIRRIYQFIHDGEFIPDDWLASRVDHLGQIRGDIDALAASLAYIRTWTYVANRANWVEDTGYWRKRTRQVEDRLSDELHKRLTKRFVDYGTSILVKRLKQESELEAVMEDSGKMILDGQELGRFQGLRFIRKQGATPEEERVLKQACSQLLGDELKLRAKNLTQATNSEFELSAEGEIIWSGHPVGRLVASQDAYRPTLKILVDEAAGNASQTMVERRLNSLLDRMINEHLGKLIELRDDKELSQDARGMAYKLIDSYGVLNRRDVARDVRCLGNDSRSLLRKYGVKFGQHSIFVYAALRPKATRLRLIFWSLREGMESHPPSPPPGLTTISPDEGLPDGYYPMCGYTLIGTLAVRVDILDRLMMMLWGLDSQHNFEATHEMLSLTGLSHDEFAGLMGGLGYEVRRNERMRPAPVPGQAIMHEDELDAFGEESPDPDIKADNASVETADQNSAPEPVIFEDIQSNETEGDGIMIADESVPADKSEEEIQVFFTYSRKPKQLNTNPQQAKPQTGTRSTARKKEFKGSRAVDRSSARPKFSPARNQRPKNRRAGQKPAAASKPVTTSKPVKVDPDNPFAALLTLRDEL